MRLVACLGMGNEKSAKVAYKTAEIEAQKQEANQFLDEIESTKRALLEQLRAKARLHGGGRGDEYPRSSH